MTARIAWASGLLALACSPAWAEGPKVGDPAPEIKAERWYNTKSKISTAKLRGYVVGVEFWATW